MIVAVSDSRNIVAADGNNGKRAADGGRKTPLHPGNEAKKVYCVRESLWWKFTDRLMLLSPKTWYGVFRVVLESPFSPLDGILLAQVLACMVLPFATLIVLNCVCLETSNSVSLIPAAVSPWMMYAIHQALKCARQASQQIEKLRVGRFVPLPTALEVIGQRVEMERLVRNRRFDMYLPPRWYMPATTNSNSDTNAPQKGVIIFPGALVPHSAYSEVAAKLSDSGLIVAVLSLEPTRLAHHHLGASPRSIQKLIHRAERMLGVTNVEWSLLGHSMGSFAAARIAPKLSEVNRLVLWGMGAFLPLATDLTKSAKACDILLVQGTDDDMVEFGISKGWQEEFDSMFPIANTQRLWIKDGTHDGFASYHDEHQHTTMLKVPPTVGPFKRTQHDILCKATADFIMNGPSAMQTKK